MGNIWTMGELLVEVMREEKGVSFLEEGVFRGPFPSGAPAIFVDTVSKLGVQAGIIGAVGDDDFGKCILHRLHQHNVNTDFVQIGKESTGVAFVRYDESGERHFIFHFSNSSAVEATFTADPIFNNTSFFHVMGCSLAANEVFANEILYATRYFRSIGAKITFDPNMRPELLEKNSTSKMIVDEILSYSSYIFPGVDELKAITEEELIEKGVESLFEYPLLKAIVLKKGSKGCDVYTREEKLTIPSFPITEIDPTGAGDCFDAGFLASLIEGKSIKESAIVANAVGALNAMAFGPMEGNISKKEVERLLCLKGKRV